MPTDPKSLKYLWIHSNYDGTWMIDWHQRQVERRRAMGYDVELLLFQPDPPSRDTYYFPRLDKLWKRGDIKLMRLYDKLARAVEGRDVLIHYNGVNLHPEFLNQLNVFKVFHCADDPESTEILSRPVAHAYDIHLVSNVAEVEMYRSWGLQHVYFYPLGSLTNEDDVRDLTQSRILDQSARDIPAVFFGAFGGVGRLRLGHMAALYKAFPEAYCAGSGWPRGFVPYDEMWQVYRRAQIGWNAHNSTGPINFRLYELPAFGVMQICDNKSHLGHVFELGKEIIGYETTEECIELTKFYLAHPEAQREIALAGHERWKRDYTPDRVWERMSLIISRHFQAKTTPDDVGSLALQLEDRAHRLRYKRLVCETAELPQKILRPLVKRVRRKIQILNLPVSSEQ
jgi:spore maturation protein CgeB